MLDVRIRKIIDPALNRLATHVGHFASANQVSVAGFIIGMTAIPLLAVSAYNAALVAILLNRLCDGLDGAIARLNHATDFGGYLDIVLDFIFYSAVIFGFCLAQPESAIAGALLIFSFVGTGSSFLAYAIVAEKRKLPAALNTEKSFFYLGGLTEGTETIVFFSVICLFPEAFYALALLFSGLCWLTTGTRMYAAYQTLR